MNPLVRTAFAGIAVTVGQLLASASPAAAFTAADPIEPPSNNWTLFPVGPGSSVDYTNAGPHGGVRVAVGTSITGASVGANVDDLFMHRVRV